MLWIRILFHPIFFVYNNVRNSLYPLFYISTLLWGNYKLKKQALMSFLRLKRQDRVGIRTHDLPNCRILSCKQRRLSDLILSYNSEWLRSTCQYLLYEKPPPKMLVNLPPCHNSKSIVTSFRNRLNVFNIFWICRTWGK